MTLVNVSAVSRSLCRPVLGKFVELNEDGLSWLLSMKGKSGWLRKGCNKKEK